MKVMIINGRREYYEYDTSSVSEALESYIREKLGFGKNFSLNEFFWGKIRDSIITVTSTPSDFAHLVNGFIKRDSYKIETIFTNYTCVYTMLKPIKFKSTEGFIIYKDGVQVSTDISVQYGEELTLRFAAAPGYVIERIAVTGVVGADYDSYTQTLVLPNVTEQITLDIETTKIDGDCYLEFCMEDGAEDYLDASMNTAVILSNGATYSQVIKLESSEQVTREREPVVVAVYKDGELITDLTGYSYTFDKATWEGTFTFDGSVLSGQHIRVVLGAHFAVDKYGYDLNYFINDNAAEGDDAFDQVHVLDNKGTRVAVEQVTLSHYRPMFYELFECNDSYMIQSVSVQMSGIEVEDAYYIDEQEGRHTVYIKHVIGDVVISVTTKKK